MRAKAISMTILCSALAAGAALPAVGGDWPTARGGAARTGFVAEQAAPPLAKAWESGGHGVMVSGPVICDGAVYVGSRDKRVYAFDWKTGALLWQYETGGWVDATPAVSGNALYAVSMDGNLYSFDRRSGSMAWKAPLGASSVSSPLVMGGRVWVGAGSPENKLKVFDAASGGLVAEFAADQPVDSPPSSDGSRVYFGANNGKLYAYGAATLSQDWFYQTMGGRYGTNAAAVGGGMVYAVPGYDEKKPLVLDAATGVPLNQQTGAFEDSTSWEQVGSPVLSGDGLYFSGGAAAVKLYALQSTPTAQALNYVWSSTPTLGAVSAIGTLSSPAMAGNVLYAGTAGGSLVAYSSAGLQLPLVADVSFSSPVYSSPGISNGMIYVGGADGRLVAYAAARVASFTDPAPGEVVGGTITLKGYISNPDLAGYALDYSTGGTPAVWTAVLSSVTARSVAGGQLGAWDVSALPNGEYTLRLKVLENSDPAAENYALLALRVDAAPAPPAGLTAADVPGDSGNRIKLDWTASATPGVSAYRIYRSSGQAATLLGSAAAPALTYVDTAAVTGITFTYSVRAFDGYSESADSNLASAFSVNNTGDVTPPSRVDDLAAAPGEAGGVVSLVWTAPGNDGRLGTAAGYSIKYTSAPGRDWAAFDSGTGFYGSTRAAEGPFGAREQQDVPGLAGGVTYYFALKAFDAVPNYSPLSNVTTAWAAVDPVPPLPPTDLTAADTPGDGGGSITLTWGLSPDDGAGAGDVYGYRIYRRTPAGAYVSTAPYAVAAKGARTYADAAATDNIRYFYSVAAFDSTNNSALSGEASAVAANNWRFFDASRGVSVRLQDGVKVDVPANAASQNDNILVTRLDPATYQPLFRAAGLLPGNPTGLVYRISFEKATTKLLSPAVITLPYADSDVAGMSVENLRIYALAGSKWVMVDNSRPADAAKAVTAKVMSFGTFAVMEYVPAGALLSADEVYTYPNPAKGSSLTFKFRVADKSFVKIDVYNVAGQRVARLQKADCPAGATSEIVWEIGRIASGVYQYRAEAASASGTKSVVKRLAIIH